MRTPLFAPVLALALAAAPLAAPPALDAGGHVVINEAYVNGGSTGATYKNKYVELHNPTASAVPLDGWSLDRQVQLLLRRRERFSGPHPHLAGGREAGHRRGHLEHQRRRGDRAGVQPLQLQRDELLRRVAVPLQ